MEEMIKLSSSLESIEYIVWGRDTLYFNMVDEVKKAMAKLNALQPEKYMDGGSTNDHFRRMRAFEQAIKEAQNGLYYYCSILKTSKSQGYNNATIGTCNKGGEWNQLLEQADDVMHLILELYKNNKKGINLDCCDPTNKPENFHLQAATKLINLLNALQPYIDQLVLVHELNLSSVDWFAANYNKFPGEISKDMAKLRDISVGGLVADALV